jgi:transposase InsO family protein
MKPTRGYSSPGCYSSQFTSCDFTGALKDADVAISMDGRGRCMDNIFIERLWRPPKSRGGLPARPDRRLQGRTGIGEWIDFYNTERPHSALASQTPAEACGAERPVDMMDKARALPTSPQAQQQQQDVINRVLTA